MYVDKHRLVAGALWFGIAVLGALQPTIVSSAECETRTDNYRINVVPLIPKARLDHTKGKSEMSRIAGVPVVGLHTMGLSTKLDIDSEYYPVADGYCFWVSSVTVEISAQSPYVFVASEYPKGGCNYNAILAHEDDHAIIAKSVIENFKPDFRRPLTSLAIPKPHSPDLVDDPDVAYARITDKIWALLSPVLENLSRTMNEAQRDLDSEAEYRRVSGKCVRW